MPNLHIYRSTGLFSRSAKLGDELREVILPKLFKYIWQEKLDPGTVDIVFTDAHHSDVNKSDLSLLMVPQAHIRRVGRVDEMKLALRREIQRFLEKDSTASAPSFEVDIAFNFGGGVSDSGNDWGSQTPLLVDRDRLEMALSQARRALFEPTTDMVKSVDGITAALAIVMEMLSAAAGGSPFGE